jgi:signal transduction histidine kinase
MDMDDTRRQRDLVVRRILAVSRVDPELPDLATLARVIAEGLQTHSCRIAVADGVTEPSAWAQWSAESGGAGLRVREVRFGGEVVGWLALPVAVFWPGPRRRLVTDILVVLGPVLDAVRLRLALGRELHAALTQVGAIASARQRTVARMDEQRRLLERNLHDGAQHHLVNLRLMVGLLEHQLAVGDEQAVIAQLGTLAEQIAQAEAVLYETASGILPVSLVAGGLCAALAAEIGTQDGVTLHLPAEPPRYPQAIETAIFYACLEAVTNARKHAPGAAITVTLHDTERGPWFAVRDDGPGFDPLALPPGSGLGRLSERVAAVGGTVTVSSAPGRGTVLEGVVPL